MSIPQFSTSTPSPTTSSTPTSPPTSPSTSTSSTPPSTHTSSPTPIGPIVGGTIGGVAVLAGLAFGIFFILRSRKKRNEQASSDVQQAQFAPHTAPEGAAGYSHPQAGSKEYYQAQNSPVSPYSAPGSPPLGAPAPQYQQQTPPYNYQQAPTEIEGTAIRK
ncbi:hypothetical protein N431DRAFT_558670 [Stipitochalara longipes BDJ]|nr:hypothetical protein N431DRAFT_558670 [Stipitochalara longipes BDJ]